MTIASDIRGKITTNIASYTEFRVSDELPFTASGEELYIKNKKTVYVDEGSQERVQLYRTLDQGSVYATETIVNAFLTVDAKNQPSNIDTVITSILDAKDVVTGTQINESLVQTDIEEDYITYSFEYTVTKLI
tara:strand:- start:548 stop:946 length:399 start_codon:yes stop_codon:yes gene_type:complete